MRSSRIGSSLEDIAYHPISIFYHLVLQIEVEGKNAQSDIDIVINTCVITKGKPLSSRYKDNEMHAFEGKLHAERKVCRVYPQLLVDKSRKRQSSRPLQERKMQNNKK